MLSAATAYPDRLAVDVADAQSLRAKAASGDRSALVAAAKQFEAMLVSQMLKNMRQVRFNDEDDPMTGGEGMKLYQDLLDKQWADQISKGRGLGFADMMVKALDRLPGPPAAGEQAPGTDKAKAALAAEPATGTAAPVQTPPAPQGASLGGSLGAKQDFLARMGPHAEAAATATGVPAAFILGHAALESGWGRHEIKDAKGQASHNLFGIKAGRSWDGAVAETVTTEYRQGVPMKLVQSFRAYSDYTSAFTDYANLLKARYGQALGAGDDATAFAEGLAAGGYATDPAYAGKLQSVIASVDKHLALAGS